MYAIIDFAFGQINKVNIPAATTNITTSIVASPPIMVRRIRSPEPLTLRNAVSLQSPVQRYFMSPDPRTRMTAVSSREGNITRNGNLRS